MGFWDLALSIRLPAIKVVFLAAGGEKRTLCSNHKTFPFTSAPIVLSSYLTDASNCLMCPSEPGTVVTTGLLQERSFFLKEQIANCPADTEGEIVSLWMPKRQ